MGDKSVANDPGDFAQNLSAYLAHAISDDTTAKDGRWLAAVTGARGKGYWSGILKGDRVMNMNDVDIIASAADISPFDFVRYARQLAESGDAPKLNVRPHPEAIWTSSDPGERGLAAERERKPGE